MYAEKIKSYCESILTVTYKTSNGHSESSTSEERNLLCTASRNPPPPLLSKNCMVPPINNEVITHKVGWGTKSLD